MRLCVATNWEDEYLRKLAALQTPDAKIHEVFGSLARSVTGSGREAGIVPDVSRDKIRSHIAVAHSLGIKFNYLMNASTMSGAEFTPDGRAAVIEYARWIAEAGADSITITIPYLVELVREVAPKIEIVVSTIAHVDSVAKAMSMRKLGADRICVSLMINRDFALLSSIRKKFGPEIELLANELCLYMCPYRTYHYDLMSLNSGEASCGSADYPHLKCSLQRMKEPAELLKARFIRPEDVHMYEEMGIDLIKLAGRGADSAHLLRAAGAYARRRWDGNLIDITDFGLFGGEGIRRPNVFIDNRMLDGFLTRSAAVDCREACTVSCHVCETYAEKAVRIEHVDVYLNALERKQKGIVDVD